MLRANGPALLFESVPGHTMPVLGNLFGTQERVAQAMGVAQVQDIRQLGEVLASLKEPQAPHSLREAWGMGGMLKQLLNMAPKKVSSAPCHEVVWQGAEVDLRKLPIQHCWPGDVAPLVTWGLVITRGPNKTRQNLGIYASNCSRPTSSSCAGCPHRAAGRWIFATTH